MAWDWERIEHEWLHEVFEAAPHPWKEGLILLWLRHAERGCRHGYRYWTPKTAAPQIEADARHGRFPGRRAIASITGISAARAKVLVADWSRWMDPASIGADVKVDLEPRPAGLRAVADDDTSASKPSPLRVQSASDPGSVRVESASDPSSAAKRQVGPASVTRVQSASDPGSVRVESASDPGSVRVESDRARDLRAERSRDEDEYDHGSLSDAPPEPTETPPPSPPPPATAPAPRGLARGSTSGGWTSAANAASAAVGGLASSPGAPPPSTGPPADPLPQIWAHAAQYGPLPAWGRGLLPPTLRDHDPVALCRVIDWARRAPDPDAAAVRHAIETRARGALGPGYILDARWLADRLVRAEAWDHDGRPEAEGAHIPEPEQLARRQAAEAAARAEDAARWPGWEPPPGWTDLSRVYAALCADASAAQALTQRGGGEAVAAASWLAGLRGRGWRDDWPGPAETPPPSPILAQEPT